MILYFFIYFYSCMIILMDILDRKKDLKKIFIFLLVNILIIVSGTRYYMGGTDYLVYKSVYDRIPTILDFFINFSNLDTLYTTFGHEKGYLFLISIFKTLGFNFYGFTLVHAILFYSIFFFSISRYTNNMGIVFIVFMYKLFFYNTFISMRQSLTIALFVFMWKYIEKRDFKKYILWCLICFSLHRASIVFIPLYFINRIKISKKLIIVLNLIFIPTTIFSLLNINILQILSPILSIISDGGFIMRLNSLINGNVNPISIIHTLEYFLCMALVIKNYDIIVKKNPKSEIVLKIFVILLPIFTFFRGYGILTRIKDYFIITYGILLGDILMTKNIKNTVKIIILIYYCLFALLRFIILFDNGHLINYKSYLFRDIDIFRNF